MTPIESKQRADLDEAIVATVAYSDVFDMPLERNRLGPFLIGVTAAGEDLTGALDWLVDRGRLVEVDGLLHLPGREVVLAVHADRAPRAAEMWKVAGRWGVRLGRVPFVRAVAVTGGLACDSVADHDDIDYLIITEPGRLWLTRLLCVVVVHVARLRGVDLCPNYLVAADSLLLDDRTTYTARELAQMIDIVGSGVLDDMRTENSWLLGYLPNAALTGDRTRTRTPRFESLRRVGERVLSTKGFDRLERWEMRRKIAKLQEVASRRPEVGRPDESAFSSSVCKGHMVGNAKGIEIAWQKRIGQPDADK